MPPTPAGLRSDLLIPQTMSWWWVLSPFFVLGLIPLAASLLAWSRIGVFSVLLLTLLTLPWNLTVILCGLVLQNNAHIPPGRGALRREEEGEGGGEGRKGTGGPSSVSSSSIVL